ncbi:MAG: tetratricopeptide repeat protein [Spirochaetaceae bacterium]|nr:tetratricopeptide repeat protein [Spirochaetaceae bacterium]
MDFSGLVFEMEGRLRSLLHLPSAPTFKSRVKTFSSYYSKLLRLADQVDITSEFPLLTDLIAIRVICPFLDDVPQIEQQLKANFAIREVEYKGINRSFDEFGYVSTHVLLEVPESMLLGKTLPDGLLCEVQIRTILQDAWAEVEHELIYKSEFNPFDLPLKRKLASINASLSLADTIFQEIRIYQKNLHAEMDCRRTIFYDKADKLLVSSTDDIFSSDSGDSVGSSHDQNAVDFSGTIDDLLLRAIHAQNSKDFNTAIAIYTHIIDEKPPNNVVFAVILNHRGMAYFAQSDFEKARDDFSRAGELDEKNLRSCYYLGIVLSVLGDDVGAIENFTRTLALNSYQSRVYFRRALSYFHIADYTSAMADVSSAIDLGFNNDDVQKLKSAILEKLEIK